MSNTKKNHLRERAQKALRAIIEHSLGFCMLCITHIAIFHPSRLNNPLFLFISIISFLYTLATPTNNFGQADAISTYRKRLLETVPESERTNLKRFQILQNLCMYCANALQLALVWSIVLSPTGATSYLIASYLGYFAVSCLRDYLTQEHTLEFFSYLFGITIGRFSPGIECTVTPEDHSSMHMTRQSLQPETLQKHQIGCQLEEIITLDTLKPKPQGALLKPRLLKHKVSQKQYWAEASYVIENIHQLDDYLIYDHTFPIVQEKIEQTRDIIKKSLFQYENIEALYKLINDLNRQATFTNYTHAISQTADIELTAAQRSASIIRVKELARHPVMLQIDAQYEKVKSLIQDRCFKTTKTKPPSTELPSCDIISFGAAAAPLEITFTHKERAPAQTKDLESAAPEFIEKVDRMIVDARNLLTFLNTSPTDHSLSSRKESDIKLLTFLKNTTAYFASSRATQSQLDHLESLITTSFKPCNPISLAIHTYESNCGDVLRLMLTLPQLRSRLLDEDLLPTLETSAKTLWDYCDQRGFSDIKQRIIDECYTQNAHDGMLDSTAIYSTKPIDSMFKKRWPSIQQLMIGPDSDIKMAFNTTIMDRLHRHAKAVIAMKIIPQAFNKAKQLQEGDPFRTYYVTTDKGFRKCNAGELDTKLLAGYSLFSSGAIISSKPQITKPSSVDNTSIIITDDDGKTCLPHTLSSRSL
jgi:hypothetical protein